MQKDTEGYQDLCIESGGCLKKVLQAGDGTGCTPQPGNKIFLHYTICLAGSGVLVDSSRGEGAEQEPFDFYLGQTPSEAMPGWDVAVQTMEKGERASIICSPQYAYGEAGAPPKIPPGASLECELELLDWEDVAARYSKYARPGETHEERMERWEQEIESGTSPIKEDVGPQPGIRTATADEVTKGKMVDVNDPQVRRAAARQLVCGQGEGYTYLEKGAFLDLYVIVPEGTRAADVLCDIAPRRLSLRITAQPDAPPLTVLEGTLHGRVALDGSYWVMSEVAPEAYDELTSDVGFGLTARGAFVQVYLEKLPPDDTIWPDVFAE